MSNIELLFYVIVTVGVLFSLISLLVGVRRRAQARASERKTAINALFEWRDLGLVDISDRDLELLRYLTARHPEPLELVVRDIRRHMADDRNARFKIAVTELESSPVTAQNAPRDMHPNLELTTVYAT